MESELSLDLPFYDTSTFYGRFRNILNVTDPRTLFTTKKQVSQKFCFSKQTSTQQNIILKVENFSINSLKKINNY